MRGGGTPTGGVRQAPQRGTAVAQRGAAVADAERLGNAWGRPSSITKRGRDTVAPEHPGGCEMRGVGQQGWPIQLSRFPAWWCR